VARACEIASASPSGAPNPLRSPLPPPPGADPPASRAAVGTTPRVPAPTPVPRSPGGRSVVGPNGKRLVRATTRGKCSHTAWGKRCVAAGVVGMRRRTPIRNRSGDAYHAPRGTDPTGSARCRSDSNSNSNSGANATRRDAVTRGNARTSTEFVAATPTPGLFAARPPPVTGLAVPTVPTGRDERG
jgi:hypothetical protein